MFRKIRDAWRALMREYDLRFLWPSIKAKGLKGGMDLKVLQDAFLIHVMIDSYWSEVSQAEIGRLVRERLR